MMNHFQTFCLNCETLQNDPAAFHCTVCGGPIDFRYRYDTVSWDNRFRDNMWRYWRLLPVADPDQIVTLNEGGTPLLPSHAYGNYQAYLKDETRNPTGSHKDRPLSVAINHGRAIGADLSVVVSTGSTGISNAALAARAGMRSVVVMTEGTPAERLYPMFALGSTLVEVRGDIDRLVDQVITICRQQGLYLSSTSRSSNPFQSEGNKTIAYEIVEDLGRAPDWMVVPAGGGGTIAGIWRGFCDLQALDKISSMPKMIGVVPKDYNALEVAFGRCLERQEEFLALPYQNPPPSILVKLAHRYPPDGMEALRAVRAAQGFFLSVTDEEAMMAQQEVGRKEGLYVEPSTGACLAGATKLLASGRVHPQDIVVVLVSGSGFRETFVTMERRPFVKHSTTTEELAAILTEAARKE